MEIQNVEQLIASLETDQKYKYHLFWGHTPKEPGKIDKSCLSNWYPEAFIGDHLTYLTAEHFMMAEKARLFGDQETRQKILDSKNPGAAKRLGRQVKGFDEAEWLKARMDIVIKGNYAKFSQNQDLRDYLIKTGNKILVEASPVDKIWGIGLAKDHEFAEIPQKWRGLNLLGFALMQVRQNLITDQQP